MNTSQRWWISFPFLLALVALVLLAWIASLALIYPYDGIVTFDPTGLITEIDPLGPTSYILSEGDVILSVNHIPLTEAQPLYPDQRAGDTVELIVQREGDMVLAGFHLIDPSLEERLSRLAPLFVALIFWGFAVGIQAFKPATEVTNLSYLMFFVAALLLICLVGSMFLPPWAASLANFLLWMIGPLAVHFHFYFPQVIAVRCRRYILGVLYIMAAIGGLPYLLLGAQAVQSAAWFPRLLTASRIFLIINFLLVIGLLIYSYRNATTAGVRGKIRIVVLGGMLSLLAIVTLTILPDVLLRDPIVPYAYAFVLLGSIPLTYGYAVFRHRLIEIERHVNRGATFILVYIILGAFYLVLYVLLNRWLPEEIATAAGINTIIVLILASIFVPLHRRVQRVIDIVFYGGWYDYRSAVSQITRGLEQINDLQMLADTVSERLAKTLRLEETCVFLAEVSGDFTVIAVNPQSIYIDQTANPFSPLPRTSLSYLLNLGEAVERSALRNALSLVELSPEENRLLNSEQVNLWVPIIGHGRILGLLALGPKFGGDIFSGEDIDILRVVARQISPMIENIHLVTRLKRYAADLEKRVEERTEELHASKERVEAILASVGEGVVVTDLDGRFVTVNAAYENQTGYTADELIGNELWNYYEGEDVLSLTDEIRDLLMKGKTWKGDLIGRHQAGNRYNLQLTVTPLRNEDNQIVGFVGSQRDITQQKELDRLKDLFVSDVSHELRTPTTNISLYLELLENANPKKRKEYISVLKEQSYLLMKLVEDILDLSRLTIGRAKKIEFAPVDLNLLIERIVTAHRPMAEAAGLMLVFEPYLELPPVWGEYNQLARVVNNLLSNAIRYTSVGGIYVRTNLDSNRVNFEVTDTGIGIDPEDQLHLFERFYRGRRVRQSKIHGTGLGLAIVKEIVDLHDGEIYYESEVGKGSTFYVNLPIQVNDLWQERQSSSSKITMS